MKNFKYLFSLCLCLFVLNAYADKVSFVSGEMYQIRVLSHPGGMIMPSNVDAQAISYNKECSTGQVLTTELSGNNSKTSRNIQIDQTAWWKITKTSDGHYTITNAATGRYFTFDGIRSYNRRYVFLSKSSFGTRSKWDFYVAQTGLGITSAYMSSPIHYLDVRYSSYIVGTFANPTSSLHDNERFFLINKKGQVVTSFGGESINLPQECFEGDAKNRIYTTKRNNDMPSQNVPDPDVFEMDNMSATFSTTSDGRAIVQNWTDYQNWSSAKSASSSRRTQTPRTEALLPLSVNGVRPVLLSNTSTYLYAIDETKEGKVFKGRIATTEDGGTLFVDGNKLPKDGSYSFANPAGGRTYHVSLVVDGDTVKHAGLTFTFLPIVELDITGNASRTSFGSATFRLMDPKHHDTDSIVPAKVRQRGHYAMLFSKTSYAVKFTNAIGKKQDRKWLNLRQDNYVILDAMAVDHARQRNRVAMDLWNDMDVQPYYASSRVKSGTEGCFAEVFVNGKYQGIYNLTDHIDRSKLSLVKGTKDKVHGVLYKSNDCTAMTLLGYDRFKHQLSDSNPPSFHNTNYTWSGWESKYPDIKPGEQTNWQPIYDAVKFVCTASDKTFAKDVSKVFDLPAVRDYYLFLELLHATDNSGKNMYWAVGDATKSSRLTPIPWDLDGTFGRDWGGHRSSCNAANDFAAYLKKQNAQNALFERLAKTEGTNWQSMLSKRYKELRRTVFSPESLYNRFKTNWQLMQRSGALQRETGKWGNSGITLDFSYENSYIKEWIEKRIETLDEQYGYR